MSSNGDGPQHSSPESPAGNSAAVSTAARTSCDLCKRMKIRCTRQDESCLHCIARSVKCEVTLVPRKKHAKRGQALLGVESRLKSLESVISSSGIGTRQIAGYDGASPEPSRAPADVNDRLSNLLLQDRGDSQTATRFVGPSSGFSLFSPQGLQWISEITGNNNMSKIILAQSKSGTGWPQERAEIFRQLPPEEHEPLPQRDVAERYVQCYFDTFNIVFPLYDRDTYNKHIERQYSDKPLQTASWYACFNIVLGIGSMISAVHSQQTSKASRLIQSAPVKHSGWKYFRNACSCLIDLVFKDCDLMAVQALCGMVFIQQITLDPQPFSMLAATAVRLAYGIGLHRTLDEFGFSQLEKDERRNVFWTIYIMDKNVALRCGQPSAIADDDIGVDLPQERSFTENFPDGTRKFDMFRCQIQLALLESRIYTELYSIRSRTRSESDRLTSVSQLDKELQEWREALPVEIRPEMPIKCSKQQLIPLVMIHFAYFNCLTTVHRVSIHHGSWTSNLANQGASNIHDQNLNPRVYASQSICLTMARNTIQLLQIISRDEDSVYDNFICMTMYYPLSSFLTLFANTLQNPRDSYIASDLQLMNFVTTLLSPAVQASPFSANASLKLFGELSNTALKFVEKTHKANVQKPKRGHQHYKTDFDDMQLLADITKTIDPLFSSRTDSKNLDNQTLTYGFQPSMLPTMTPNDAIDMSTASSMGPIHIQQNFPFNTSQSIDQYQSSSPFSGEVVQPIRNESIPPIMSQHPNVMTEGPIFSEFFEWDLAFLWNHQ